MRAGSLMIGWLMAVGMAVVIGLRWTTLRAPLLIALVGVAWLLLLFALAVLVVAAWRSRSRVLRIVAAMAAIGYLITFTNVRAVVGCGPETAADAITVFHHNVYLGQGDPVQVAGSLTSSGADLVVLLETWPEFMDQLERQPGLETYIYRVSEPAYGPTGLALLSRWPLDDVVLENVGRRPLLRATAETPYGPVVVHVIHASAPVEPAEVADWEVQLAHVGALNRAVPTIVVGDFNATIDHVQFRRLLETGWSDVHTPKGCGPDQTWPTSWGTGIALMRLDHVLVTDHFDVLSLELGDPDGSDHHSVITRIRLDQPPAG